MTKHVSDMKILTAITLLSLATALTACIHESSYSSEIKNELKILDGIVDDNSRYKEAKRQKISDMLASLRHDDSDLHRYEIYDDIYREYYQYNLDSAMAYAKKKLVIAGKTDSYRVKTDAVLDLAERYVLSGMYAETLQIIDTLDTAHMDSTLLVKYFHVGQSLYEDLSSTSDDPDLKVK